MASATGVAGTVVSLHRYPIKSMRGEELDAADVTERGILGDRGYALIDTETGKVVSAKNPRKWARMFECAARYIEPPLASQLLPPVIVTLPDGTPLVSSDDGFEAALSRFLGRAVNLTATPSQMPIYEHFWFDYQTPLGRPVENPEGDILTTVPAGFGAPGTFFDYTPLHLLTTNTLAKLREIYPEGDWHFRRFRPNVVIEAGSGQAEFVEDAWIGGGVTVGQVAMKVIDTMSRCVMTTLAQGDLPDDPRIMRTLVDHHLVTMPAIGREVPSVGVAVTVATAGRLSRGDRVTVEPEG